jgi:PAS domain S-box-containing protein
MQGDRLSRQLKDSERIFSLLVRSVKDYGIFMLDTEGRLISWNEGAQHILGYSAEEVIGKHFSMFYTAEALAANHPQHELETALTAGRYEEEGWRVRKNGETFWATAIISPVYDNGVHVGYAKVTRDLTERRRSQIAQEHFRLMISAVRDYAIFMLDPQGNVMTWNEGAQRIKGYTASDIIGKHFSTFYPQEVKDRGHPQYELEVAKQQGRYEEKGWRVRKDGSMFWANVLITALWDQGQLVGFAKVTRDLTERRRTEQIKEEQARRLSETNDELQRLAYVISHEMQAPISTISRYGNLLTVRYKEALGRDAFEFFDKISEATKLVARMVDDLWTYARVSKPNALHELVYVRHCVNDAIEQLHDQIGEAQITIEDLPSVDVNRTQLTFVFKELITNALRNRTTDTPRIRISGRKQADTWLFSVEDNGIGLDKVYSSEVFQLFHRLRGGPEPHATGMGLAICRKIVGQHGGHIWYESEPGQGTTFYFTIPESAQPV